MNKIFKVIWSKSKQCYVVVSEITKNTTGKKKIIVASILAGLAMSTMGPNVMAVSSIPFTDKPSSALGNGSVKSGTTNGVAIGNAAYSDSNQSIAIGFRSLASGTFLGGSIKPSVAVGAGAHAEGNNTVAIGTVAENRASYGVSLGNESKVTSGSDYGIAIGFQTQVSNVHGMAIGEKASASGFIGMALGANAKATGSYSYAGGLDSESGGEAAIAVGKSASAGGGDAVAIGTSSQATGGDSIALGKNANASNGDSIAIGQDTVSDKINSVALGKTSKATGASATALGPQAKATGSTAVAIGLNSEANQSATVAVGYNSAASGENAAAYGNTAKAAGKNSLALGANTQATVEGGVALGAGSIANTVAGAGYNPNTGRTNTFTGLSGNALTSTWAAVSIGDGTNTRQLTGLAAGTNNTDAVNVAQLKSMNLAFTADGSTQGDVNLTNSALNVVGDSTYITTKGNNQTLTISGKKQNITVTNGTASASAGMADANNVAQAINQANADQTISYKVNGGTANTVKVSDGLNFKNGTTTVATVGANGQVTYDLNTTTKQSITDSSTAVNRTIALGGSTGSTTAKKLASGDVKFNIKGQTGTNALISTSASGDDVTIAPTAKLTAAVTAAENAANKDLSNLNAAGDTYIKNLAKSAASWNVETNGAGTTAVAGGDTVNFIDGDNIAITNTGRSITIGTAKNVSFDKVTVGGIVLDKTAGINAGNKEIKGVANATSADAAVNKGQMDAAITAAAGGSLSTEKVVAKTLTGDNNLATVAGQTGTAKGETYEVSVSENAVKAVAATAAQDAVKVAGTGLATVSDTTAAGVKTYTVNVDEGKLVIDDTTGKIGANGATQGTTQGKNGVATTQDVASVVNSAIDKTKQALDDAKHNFAGDDATVISRKHGEQLNIKGGASTTASDLTSGNIAVVGDTTSGTLNIKMAKALTGLTSATYTDAAGNTQTVTGGSSTISDAAGNSTVVSKGGVTTTDGTNTTTVAPSGITATDGTHTVTLGGSGISAGGTEIKNVGKATTDDAAVNKKQMDDAVKAATDSISTLGDNKVSLGSDSGTTTAKKLSTTGGIKFNIKGDTGANALITTSATGDDVTIAPTAKLSAAVTAAENSANKDLSNLSTAGNTYIQNLAKSAASWNVETNGAGTTAVAGGDTINFINGDNIAITNTGRSITIGTAKNVSFDKVTVGGVVIDKNNGIDAGGKEITNVGPATSGNSAVNKTQMDTAITNAVNKATTDAKHDFGGDDTTVVTRKHGEKLNIKGGASTTAADLTSGNIAVLGDAATGTLNIRMAKALTGLSSATFTTPSGTTVINGGGMTITPSTTGAAPISITTGGINAGNTEIKNVAAGTTPNSAVNKQQMDSAISNATANVGFSTAGNTGTGSVSNGQTLTITGTNGIETNASGQSITVGLDAATRAQINNATTTANNAAKKDLSNIDNAGKQVIKDTAAWNVKVNSGTPETVKGGDTVTFNDGDNIKVTNTGKDITIATKKDVSFDKVTVGNVVIDKNTNRISGLANAANNDEAVNLGQMNAAISTATAGTGTIKYKANGGTQNSVALTTGFDFKGDSNIQITADPANSGVINYKLNPALTGITSISGGTGAPTITLNAGSGSTPGNVSINSNLDMGGKQINNIGAATHAGDAVNKAQMDQALQNIAGASSNAAKSYAYKAGAGAAALAALKPIQYDPLEPTQIMAGIGNYKSQTAVALGVAHYTNENTMFNLGVSLDSHDGIVNAGVTHKFGYSPEKKAIPDKYKGGPISSIYVMQDEVTALQAIVQKQAAENEALRQQNEDMQRKVDMILSKIH